MSGFEPRNRQMGRCMRPNYAVGQIKIMIFFLLRMVKRAVGWRRLHNEELHKL
jgi:hypothetical protein